MVRRYQPGELGSDETLDLVVQFRLLCADGSSEAVAHTGNRARWTVVGSAGAGESKGAVSWWNVEWSRTDRCWLRGFRAHWHPSRSEQVGSAWSRPAQCISLDTTAPTGAPSTKAQRQPVAHSIPRCAPVAAAATRVAAATHSAPQPEPAAPVVALRSPGTASVHFVADAGPIGGAVLK